MRTCTAFYALGAAVLSNAQTIDLGSAASFGALAPAGVTNTGLTVVTGDVGTTGTSVTGFFTPGIADAIHISDATAINAQSDFADAYLQGKALTTTVDKAGLASIGGLTFTPGVYSFNAAVLLGGAVTLSGAGAYVFKIGTALTVSGGASVVLADGATACDVWWIVGSAATLGTSAVVSGNILAGTAISLGTSASVAGGLYAMSAITLQGNAIQACG